METVNNPPKESQRRLRAMIEIIDSEMRIFPVASSDLEATEILDAFRFMREGLTP